MLKIGIVLLLAFCVEFATAGPISSGGGKGVVCRDSQNKILSVELLDLWESRTLYNRKIQISTASLANQVQEALTHLQFALDMGSAFIDGVKYSPPQYFMKLATEQANMFLQGAHNVEYLSGVTLTLTDDSYEVARPEDCPVEQIATYVDSVGNPQIVINKDLFSQMDVTNQAALIVHESFYAILRNMYGEKNSLRARRSVGYVFAGQTFPDINLLLGSNYVLCNVPNSEVITNQYSSLYFYKVLGKFKVMPSILWGSPAIGFFEIEDKYSSIYNPMNDKNCGNTYPTVFTDVPGWGPVDFTRSASLAWGCMNNQRSLYINNGSFVPTNPATTQKLVCHEVKK